MEVGYIKCKRKLGRSTRRKKILANDEFFSFSFAGKSRIFWFVFWEKGTNELATISQRVELMSQ